MTYTFTIHNEDINIDGDSEQEAWANLLRYLEKKEDESKEITARLVVEVK